MTVLALTLIYLSILHSAMQMASALQHLHSKGIAHMDVKPDNIYSTEDGQFKLGDFGLATSLWGSKNLDGKSTRTRR